MPIKVEFETPQKLNGSMVSELELHFEEFDGDTIKDLETTFRAQFREFIMPILDFDIRYQEWVAGRAAHVNPADLGKMDAKSYKGVCTAVRNFLMS